MDRYELTIYAPNGQKAFLPFSDLDTAVEAGEIAITTGSWVQSYGVVRTEDGVLLTGNARKH